ncbi:MAG: anhydro-N-acetylmuramic acid kinase [Phycisphaeraceae bacterium]
MPEPRTRFAAGCMTGTSLDGLDVALVKILGTGLDMKAELLGHHALSMPDDLRTTLMSLASGEVNAPITFMRSARALGELHADGLEQLFAQLPDVACDFITAHGQTIWHAPGDGEKELGGGPKSWQLFDPWPVVKRLGVPVCYDLRQADLIAGGQGAPLTPITDWVMYREYADAVANLGGILNITRLGTDLSQVEGGDVYPCNLLLDGLCKRYFGKPYDADGDIAGRGRINPACVHLIDDAVQAACAGKQSLGREQFSPEWFDRLIASIGQAHRPEDVLQTAARLVAVQLGGSFREPGQPTQRLVLAGGGVKNKTLVKLIKDQSYYDVQCSDDLGIPSEAREAMAFAVLGALSQDGVPISLPQVTGATAPGVAGTWSGL